MPPRLPAGAPQQILERVRQTPAAPSLAQRFREGVGRAFGTTTVPPVPAPGERGNRVLDALYLAADWAMSGQGPAAGQGGRDEVVRVFSNFMTQFTPEQLSQMRQQVRQAPGTSGQFVTPQAPIGPTPTPITPITPAVTEVTEAVPTREQITRRDVEDILRGRAVREGQPRRVPTRIR